MKKLLLLLACVSPCLLAQVQNFYSPISLNQYLFANVPTASSYQNKLIQITDCTTAACTAGTGNPTTGQTVVMQSTWNGSTWNWVAIGGSSITLPVSPANGGTGANNTVGAAGHVLRSNASAYVDAALASTDLSDTSNLVRNNQANTYSGGGLQDFSADNLKLPLATGFTPTSSNNIGIDLTTAFIHAWDNAANEFLVYTPSTFASNVIPTGIGSTPGVQASNFNIVTNSILNNANTNATYQGGPDSALNSTVAGVTVRGGSQIGAGGASSVAGFSALVGGFNSGTNAASAAGTTEVIAGLSTGATQGLQGLVLILQGWVKGTTVTQFDLVCESAAMTVANCGATPGSIAGVAWVVNTNTVETAVEGSEIPINASAAVTLGHTVCAGSTGGQVTDSGGTGACPSGQITVGIVMAVSGTWPAASNVDGNTFTASTTLPLVLYQPTMGGFTGLNTNGILVASSATAVGTPGGSAFTYTSSGGVNQLTVSRGASQSTGPTCIFVLGSMCMYEDNAGDLYVGQGSSTAGNGNVFASNFRGATGTFRIVDNATQVWVSTGIWSWTNSTTDSGATKDTGLAKNAAGLVEINNGTAGTFRDLIARTYVEDVGTAIASASTIAPTTGMVHITGTTTISTITAPTDFAKSGMGGCIRLIPDGLWATTTGGNIAIASTAVVSKSLTMCYDNGTSLWYPSY